MTTRSGPIALVLAGTSQAGATGFDWQGGEGCLFLSSQSGTPDFQCSVDGGASWIPVFNSGSGLPITAIAAGGGAIPFKLGPCRIRLSAGGGAMNAYASRLN